MIKLSVKERREQFQFFLALFIGTVALLGFCIFYSANDRYEISKADLEEKISEDEAFENASKNTVPIVDTAYKQIVRFDPNVGAVFLKQDISSYLSSIKSVYEAKAADARYKTFLQTSQLYDLLFYNKQEMKGNLRDLENAKKSLEDCIISRQQLQQTMSNR